MFHRKIVDLFKKISSRNQKLARTEHRVRRDNSQNRSVLILPVVRRHIFLGGSRKKRDFSVFPCRKQKKTHLKLETAFVTELLRGFFRTFPARSYFRSHQSESSYCKTPYCIFSKCNEDPYRKKKEYQSLAFWNIAFFAHLCIVNEKNINVRDEDTSWCRTSARRHWICVSIGIM